MRFLIVDDNPIDRRLLSSLLERMGHEVDQSDSTKGLVELIATGKYNSVFLDIVMPEQDGYKFLRTLRSNQSTAKQHVVIYSGKRSSLEIKYGLKRAGANEYLIKPATQKTLAQLIEKV